MLDYITRPISESEDVRMDCFSNGVNTRERLLKNDKY
jgi:hypothetical protein